MGLRIVGREVIVDHAVSANLNTGVDGNPTHVIISGLTVHCVFQRKRQSAKNGRDRDSRMIGDNCPLIYALKGLDDLSVSIGSIKRLNLSIPLILTSIAQAIVGQVDVIVPMPSSSPLALMLAKRLARFTGVPVENTIFVKSTNFQALRRADAMTAQGVMHLDYKEERQVKEVIKGLRKNLHEGFLSKNVGTPLRKHFDPLQITPGYLRPAADTRFLLVDDLLSTGETLCAAKALLNAEGFSEVSKGVTWFGPVKKPSAR